MYTASAVAPFAGTYTTVAVVAVAAVVQVGTAGIADASSVAVTPLAVIAPEVALT